MPINTRNLKILEELTPDNTQSFQSIYQFAEPRDYDYITSIIRSETLGEYVYTPEPPYRNPGYDHGYYTRKHECMIHLDERVLVDDTLIPLKIYLERFTCVRGFYLSGSIAEDIFLDDLGVKHIRREWALDPTLENKQQYALYRKLKSLVDLNVHGNVLEADPEAYTILVEMAESGSISQYFHLGLYRHDKSKLHMCINSLLNNPPDIMEEWFGTTF